MSEYEILDLHAAATADQTAIIGLIISLHFAMIVGIFYFLHRSGAAMKVAILVLYTLGYALLLGLMFNQGTIVYGASRDLIALTQNGDRLSGIGYAALQQARNDALVNIIASVAMLTLWFGTIFFLFFRKRPKDAE
jgi:hypothetical protein